MALLVTLETLETCIIETAMHVVFTTYMQCIGFYQLQCVTLKHSIDGSARHIINCLFCFKQSSSVVQEYLSLIGTFLAVIIAQEKLCH